MERVWLQHFDMKHNCLHCYHVITFWNLIGAANFQGSNNFNSWNLPGCFSYSQGTRLHAHTHTHIHTHTHTHTYTHTHTRAIYTNTHTQTLTIQNWSSSSQSMPWMEQLSPTNARGSLLSDSLPTNMAFAPSGAYSEGDTHMWYLQPSEEVYLMHTKLGPLSWNSFNTAETDYVMLVGWKWATLGALSILNHTPDTNYCTHNLCSYSEFRLLW